MPFLKRLRQGLVPPWLRYFNKSLRSRRKLGAVAREFGLPPLDANPLRCRKSSDTLFILGSGASVLSYGEAEWATIAGHDSLGFNYWILHPFVPSHYVFELTKFDWDIECIRANLARRDDYVSGAAIHLKDAERFDRGTIGDAIRALPPGVAGKLNLLWDAEIPGDSLAEFARTVGSLDRVGCFTGRRQWAIPKKRATLFFAINLAVRAGYKNIVLCGVDLNNTEYFFRSEGFAVQPGLRIPPPYQSGPVHKTNDPVHGEVTISAILDVFDRCVLKPKGVTLSVAKSSSALYPRFPEFFSRP